MWASPASTAWTVILENDPVFQSSCLNRFIYVKTVAGVTQALQGAELAREKVSTVGLSATEAQAPDLARQFARWGAKRICPLLTWCDWEK